MEDLKLQLIENRKQSNDCFLLRLKGSVKQMKPGQFLNVAIPNYSLRRPISLCDLDEDIITLLIRINGEGTKYLSQLKEGSELKALLPLGNGLDLDNFEDEILLIGGGVGVAPLLYTAKKAHGKGLKVITVLGFRTRQDALLLDEFKKYSDELYLSYYEDRENVVTKILEKDLVNIKFIFCKVHRILKHSPTVFFIGSSVRIFYIAEHSYNFPCVRAPWKNRNCRRIRVKKQIRFFRSFKSANCRRIKTYSFMKSLLQLCGNN